MGKDILKQELNCSLKKLELTNQLGFDLKKEQLDALSSNGVYTGEMFGEALLKDERYVDHELLNLIEVAEVVVIIPMLISIGIIMFKENLVIQKLFFLH